MTSLKKIPFLIIFLFLIYHLYDFFLKKKNVHECIIAITQIAPHPSLDKIRQGITDALQSENNRCRIEYQNAQGSMPLALQIAQKFINLKPEIIIAITTPSALAVYQAAKNQNIPIIFSAITDPVQANLAKDNDSSLSGITGVSDYINPKKQIEFINILFKNNKIKKIGTIYNASEANSVSQINNFEKELKQTEYTFTKIAITNTADISMAALKLTESVDMIIIFNDNMVVSGMPQLLKIARERHIPVLSTDPESVELGALAAIAHEQYILGRQTGQMALKALKLKSVKTLKIEKADALSLYLNVKQMKNFSINNIEDSSKNIIYVKEK